LKEKLDWQEVVSHLLSGQSGFVFFCNILMESLLRPWFVELVKAIRSAKKA
jgi:hypothetical protein